MAKHNIGDLLCRPAGGNNDSEYQLGYISDVLQRTNYSSTQYTISWFCLNFHGYPGQFTYTGYYDVDVDVFKRFMQAIA